ncbi:MAG TPA: shikimate dehydrogenase [Pseudonocardiaceae bacterium]|nr:shikimate dehydrogenase [Pseudonocardiaceae bacterium]
MRAAVLGSPVAHSLSPVLHGAAYAELGLADWTFERIEVDAAGLPGLVGGLGPEWAGLAVTMPGKKAALAFASVRTSRAAAVGAANTLVRLPDGWRADCTDVAGVTGALTAAGYRSGGRPALLLGAGGTAAAAVAGLADLGVRSVIVVVRDPARAADVVRTASRVGLAVDVRQWSGVDFAAVAGSCELVVSTVPAAAVESCAGALAVAPCVLDVIYHPWPTTLSEAMAAAGGRLATGLDMLLHQAFGQVEQFTGKPAPKEVMRSALKSATGTTLSLPL